MARVIEAQDTFAQGISLNPKGDRAQMLQNFRVLADGSVQKRGGSRYIGPSSNPFASGTVTAGFDWRLGDGTVVHLVVTDSGTGWYKFREGSDVAWVNTASAIFGQGSFALFSSGGVGTEAVYYADTGGAPSLNRYTLGGGLTINLAGTPNVGSLAVYNRRLYGAADPGNPQRLYWSGLDDGDTLGIAPNGGFVDVITANRSPIIGIAVAGPSLLIFHKDGISRFTGWTVDDFAVDPRGVSSTVGCRNKRSICPVGSHQAAFLGSDGVYLCNGESVQRISDPLQDHLLKQVLGEQIADPVMGYHARYNELWIGHDESGIYAVNLATGAWMGPHYFTSDGQAPHAMWAGFDRLDRQQLTIGNEGFDSAMQVEACDNGGDVLLKDFCAADNTGGTNVAGKVIPRRFELGSPSLTKSLRSVRVAGDFKANINVSVRADTNTGNATVNLTTVAGDRSYVAFPGGSGAWVDVTISDGGGTGLSHIQQVELEGFTLQRHGL
jgi:hypothetical protein